MGYDRGDSYPFEFEPNAIIFGSKSKENLLPRSYPIQYERKWKYIFLSGCCRRDVNPTLARQGNVRISGGRSCQPLSLVFVVVTLPVDAASCRLGSITHLSISRKLSTLKSGRFSEGKIQNACFKRKQIQN